MLGVCVSRCPYVAHVSVGVHSTDVCVCTWRPEDNVKYLLHDLAFLRQGRSLSSQLTYQLPGCAGKPATCSLCLLVLGLQLCSAVTGCLCEFWDPNSDWQEPDPPRHLPRPWLTFTANRLCRLPCPTLILCGKQSVPVFWSFSAGRSIYLSLCLHPFSSLFPLHISLHSLCVSAPACPMPTSPASIGPFLPHSILSPTNHNRSP